MRHFLFLCLPKRSAIFAVLPLVLLNTHAAAATFNHKYVQGNYAVPQTPEPTVTVPFTAPQTAGNLNVVVVGWSDSTTHITSLTDSNGNLYQLAVGPIVTGTLSQAIYYSKNISAAATATNAVTVTFNAAANFPDIRIMEYRGIDPVNPLDTVVQGSGNSATSSTGAVTTSNATDLLVAANTVQTTTVGPGSGFTQRLLTPDSDIVEDEHVTATGSYSASAPLGSQGAWVMQMVAFQKTVSATPTRTPTPPPAVPAYTQGNYAVPQSPDPFVAVPYTASQTAGDLNVVIVGWADTIAQLKSVTDSSGNTYQLAVGPIVANGASQAIFYAANILAAPAATNSVTVTFNAAANFPDVRILEYSGLATANPVDAVMSNSGSSATSSSGTLTTTDATDLLVAANTVQTTTVGPSSGFTQRLLTPDSEIAEDELVTTTGSYNASTQLGSAGGWIMQMVAFHAGSSGTTGSTGSSPSSATTPTPTPTPKPTPTPTPTPTPATTPTPTPTPTPSSSIELSWNADAATSNSVTNTTGYRLHMGSTSGVYTQNTDVGNSTTVTALNLVSGSTYYFVVTAYNSSGVESPVSNQITYQAP